jgi:electron-transferring-flavoprotein dehydrogenase
MEQIEREVMEFDVLIVGGGPAGMASAIRMAQLATAGGLPDLQICVVEKGSEVGAHILSGAVFEPRALNELIPDWQEKGAPLNVPAKEDRTYLLRKPGFGLSKKPGALTSDAWKVPHAIVPKPMMNEGNYIISLGNLVRWLGTQAEELGVNIFPGFAAQEVLYHADGSVKGIQTGDMGISKEGEQKGSFTPGYELHAKYTIFAEGCRGHLGKQLISRFGLDADSDPQHYGIGIKELWEIPAEQHEEGVVMHGAGWPFTETGSAGGWWLYFAENNQVSLGTVASLSYKNPYFSPFDEMQRWNTIP